MGNKFYNKNWFIILSLIFIFPLGIFLMWKNKKWTRNIRIAVSILSVLFFFIAISSPDESRSTDDQQIESQSVIDEENNEETNLNEEEKQKEKEQQEREEEERKKEEEARQKAEEKKKREEQKKKEQEEKAKQQKTANGNVKAHFIDVGQADATLFQYQGESGSYHILFDTGDWRRTDAVNYLNNLGIKKLDLVIISHPHADHIGQLEDIMNQFNVKEVWMDGNTASSNVYQRALEAVLNSDATYYEPRAGEVFDVGPMKIEVIHPSSLSGDLNTDSISTRITFGSVAFVMTGDAPTTSEQQMVNRGNINAQILSLGHHGSNTSSSQSFLKAVNPDIAIYSAADGSQYGHPHADIVSRVENSGIKLYGTDVHGNIIIDTDGNKYNVSTSKDGKVVAQSNGSKSGTGSGNKSNNKSSSSSSGSSSKKDESKQSSGDCIDINSASEKDLQNIIHLGPARAKEVLDLRPFNSVDDLTRVNGIGPARIKDIKSEGKACAK